MRRKVWRESRDGRPVGLLGRAGLRGCRGLTAEVSGASNGLTRASQSGPSGQLCNSPAKRGSFKTRRHGHRVSRRVQTGPGASAPGRTVGARRTRRDTRQPYMQEAQNNCSLLDKTGVKVVSSLVFHRLRRNPKRDSWVSEVTVRRFQALFAVTCMGDSWSGRVSHRLSPRTSSTRVSRTAAGPGGLRRRSPQARLGSASHITYSKKSPETRRSCRACSNFVRPAASPRPGEGWHDVLGQRGRGRCGLLACL